MQSKVVVSQLMQKSNAELAKLSEQEIIEKVLSVSKKMDGKDKQLKDGSQSEIPITEIFYLYEGALNYDNTDVFDSIAGVVSTSADFYVDYHTDSAGDYFIYANDVVDFYNELEAEIELEIDTSIQEVLVFTDLNLIDLSGGTATINMKIYKSVTLPYFAPNSAYWGAALAGPCVTTFNNDNRDGGTFLNLYANAHKPSNMNQPCPSAGPFTSNPITITVNAYQTYFPNMITDPTYTNDPNYWNTNVLANLWFDSQNSCMGNNNTEWQTWYRKTDNLIYLQLAYAQSLVPNSVFIGTDFHSHYPGVPNNWHRTEPFFHGGIFAYGLVICP